MNTETMSITKALAELKLLGNRIDSTISSSNFITLKTGIGARITTTGIDVTKFEKDAQASFDSVTGLIARRAAIKRALVKANAETTTSVTVDDKPLTIAEVIEFKGSIQYQKNLLNQMKQQYAAAVRNYVNAEQQANKVIERNIELMNAKDSENNRPLTADMMESVRTAQKNSTYPVYIDPLVLKDKIDKLEASILEFESNVDVVLSTVNAITNITVTY